ncbi:MAG: membrane dipeptidase [Chloroflexi bacterium]|nr:membrane dipeptidase [Chloroflexota bacterium]MBI3733112.1 membrane dipeptidase [Chloroflexota bacterium]
MDIEKGVRQLGERSDKGHIDLPRLKEGGVDAQVFACWVGGTKAVEPLKHFMVMADHFYQQLGKNPDTVVAATTTREIRAAKQAGKIAAVLGMEGGEPLEGELGTLRLFYRLGLRVVTLVWGGRNKLGDAVFGDSRATSGLTDYGVEVVKEMNRLGMVIDVSHLNARGVEDVLEISTMPIIASHSNARAVFDHVRNLSDDQIRAIAAKGGLIHSVFTFLHQDRTKGSLDDVLDHMEHIMKLVGPDHLGIGSDLDGIQNSPIGLEDASKMINITRGLVARGYTIGAIRQILGENFLRVFAQITREEQITG